MKKRAPESDVRAMAAALSARQAKGPQVQLTILGSDRTTPFTASLDEATELYASITITITPAQQGPLYIGAIELVDLTDGRVDAQQLYARTAECIGNTSAPKCYLTAENLGGTPLDLNPITAGLLNPEHKYGFNLRYSQREAVVPPSELTVASADNGIGGSFSVGASTITSSSPPIRPTGSTTSTGLFSEATPDKPEDWTIATGSSTSTPTSTPIVAEPTDDSSDVVSGGGKGLSTGAKAGIGAGVAAAALIVIALLVAWWVRRSRRASLRNGRAGGVGEKESVLAAAAPGGAAEYRDADEAGSGVVGGSPVTRKPVGVPATSEAALADAVSPASTTVGLAGAQTRGAGGEGQQSMLNAEERERWEEEERRLDEDIAEAERRRLGA